MLDVVLFSFFFFPLIRTFYVRSGYADVSIITLKTSSSRSQNDRTESEKRRNFGLSLLNCSVSIKKIANNDIQEDRRKRRQQILGNETSYVRAVRNRQNCGCLDDNN